MLLEHAKSNGIFELIENDLVFDHDSTNKINLKYVFLAAKIIKTVRYVIMKLSENYPYKAA